MIEIRRIQDYTKTNWSGGTTTELFIFPKNANFNQDNYQVRISLARVAVTESNFTPLKNIERTLTVLEGNHSLAINDSDYIQLPLFSPIHFSGNDEVKSKGKSVNFNFMKSLETPHTVQYIEVNQGRIIQLNCDSFRNSFLYVITGDLILNGERVASHESIFHTESIEIHVRNGGSIMKVNF